MMFDHLELAIAVVLRPTVYAGTLSDEERAALAAARPLGRLATTSETPADRAYASQVSDGFPK